MRRLIPWEGEPGKLLLAIQWRTGIANMAGVLTVFGYLAVSAGKVSLASTSDRVALLGAGAYVVAAAVFGPILEARAFAPVRSWLTAGGAPTPRQRRAVLAQPFLQAGLNFIYWVIAAGVLAAISAAFVAGSGRDVSRVASALIMAGLMSYGLAFFLVERRLRPVYAEALDGLPADEATALSGRRLGVRQRLVLSWALGSGIFLLGIALDPLNHVPGRSLSVHHPAFYLAVVGIVAGVVLTLAAAGSVSEPLREVERAMRRVADGDLGASVVVDDPGEFGVLQAGFNTMVAGLRERELLDDLFGRHVGTEVARQALERAAEVEGEVREVSALFVDVIGSTRLAVRKDPADVVADLNALFDAVVSVVSTEGGWVNKFVGDAALCVFGAPGDQPDHGARALRAARRLRAELVALAASHPDLDAGIGVSCGPAVAGNVGAEHRYEYTVIGDAVNEADRLTELAKRHPGRVLAAERVVAAAAGGAGRWCLVERIVLRGRDEPTAVYAPAADDAER